MHKLEFKPNNLIYHDDLYIKWIVKIIYNDMMMNKYNRIWSLLDRQYRKQE